MYGVHGGGCDTASGSSGAGVAGHAKKTVEQCRDWVHAKAATYQDWGIKRGDYEYAIKRPPLNRSTAMFGKRRTGSVGEALNYLLTFIKRLSL